jgi:hypothetical protein
VGEPSRQSSHGSRIARPLSFNPSFDFANRYRRNVEQILCFIAEPTEKNPGAGAACTIRKTPPYRANTLEFDIARFDVDVLDLELIVSLGEGEQMLDEGRPAAGLLRQSLVLRNRQDDDRRLAALGDGLRRPLRSRSDNRAEAVLRVLQRPFGSVDAMRPGQLSGQKLGGRWLPVNAAVPASRVDKRRC